MCHACPRHSAAESADGPQLQTVVLLLSLVVVVFVFMA